MLVSGNLGFSRLVLVVTLLVFPVIWIVLRRKWRFAAARREEIKRLLVLAAEESARAELEATEQYGTSGVEYVSQPLQNQCAVCFSPTTKFCSQCKAVRYCSGKCQIVHWRQGHKEECHPYTNFGKSNEGKPSSQKEFNEEGYVSYGDNYELGGRKGDKKVETFPPDVLLSKDEVEGLTNDVVSNASGTSHLFQRCSESTTTYGKASFDASVCTSIDSDGLHGLRTNDGIPAKFETVRAKMDENRLPFPEQFSNLEKSSVKIGQDKPVCSDGDASCSSSGWSVDGSNDSLSEPSTPSSSGFWEGTINSKRSRLNANDDSTQSSSSESGGDMMVGHGSSLGFTADLTKDNIPPMPQKSFSTKIMISDDVSTTSGTKKHVSEAVLSEKMCDNLKTTSMHVDTGGNSRVLNSRETKASPSSNYCAHPGTSDEGHSKTKDDEVISRSSSLCSERSNKVGNDTISSSCGLRSREVGSISGKDFDSGSTFSSRRDAGQKAKLSKVDDGVHGATTSSTEFSTNSPNARNGLKSTVLKVVDQLKPSKLSRHHPMGVDSETAGKYTVKGLFPYELFVKLYNWNKVEMQPCGLVNCGNSCYANAVLQCLAFTPPITAYLLQQLHSKTCQNNEWCFTCEFESLILKAKESSSPLSPIRILSHIENIGSHLGYGREEDAHEFLRYAIDTMQSSCLKEASSKTWGSVNEETTLIGLTFGGYLRSKIKCMKCGGKSERHERMMDLTVEIDGDIYALEEALRKFTSTEILDGENKYKCSRCKSYEKAKKKLTIIEAPNVLTIALKRFQSGKFGKLSKSIQFPEILNMAPYMSSTSDMSPIYRLYGVVVHLDIMNSSFSGHYVCYLKNIQNKWFKIDDSAVIAVELESVLTKGAYMLLYARCSPRAPKLIRNSVVPRDPRKLKSPSLKSRSHSKGLCDASRTDHLNYHTSQGFYQDHHSFQRISSSLEDDSSSDNSSSIFSEACSCSTESSTRDSTSTDDYFDQIFGDSGHNWNRSRWNSSDSDTSSSSSSPSPLYSQKVHCTSSDHYATRHNGRSYTSANPAESTEDCHILCSEKSKQCRKLDSNSSCRETNSDNLGKINPLNSVKSGTSLRRSSRGRPD